MIDAETGNSICGFREKDILEKWAKGEEIPQPPRPKSPPPPPPQDFDNDEQINTWKTGYETWRKENDHMPNLPESADMLSRLKKQKEMMAQRAQQGGNPQGAPVQPGVQQHSKNVNLEWYYTVEGSEKVEVQADMDFIRNLKQQYYVRESADGKLTKVVDDSNYVNRQRQQAAQRNQQQLQQPDKPLPVRGVDAKLTKKTEVKAPKKKTKTKKTSKK
jgi:hypothetical protein